MIPAFDTPHGPGTAEAQRNGSRRSYGKKLVEPGDLVREDLGDAARTPGTFRLAEPQKTSRSTTKYKDPLQMEHDRSSVKFDRDEAEISWVLDTSIQSPTDQVLSSEGLSGVLGSTTGWLGVHNPKSHCDTGTL